MALSATTIFEIRGNATASNVNGGGFNPSNANMLTDLACDAGTGNTASPIVSSASYTFLARDVGAMLYVKSGTNWYPGWYPIVAVSGGKATLSAAIGAANVITSSVNFGASTVMGVGSVATPTAGTWAIDYSQMAASPFTATDLASSNGTTNPSTVTSAAYPFGPQMVGNHLHVTAGTNWTAGWYEIVSVSGVTATLDRAVGTAASLTAGTGNSGGALNSPEAAVFNLAVSSTTAATRFFLKGGYTYTVGAAVTITAAGNALAYCRWEGYSSYRGDKPKPRDSSLMPLVDAGASFGVSLGSNWRVECVSFTGTVNNVLALSGGIAVFCKIVNTSTTAARGACLPSLGTMVGCEAVSLRGYAVVGGSGGTLQLYGCYLHDSDVGVFAQNGRLNIINCLIQNNVTYGIRVNVANTSTGITIIGNTIRGNISRIGTGISFITGTTTQTYIMNNNINGFVTGISHADANLYGLDLSNNFYNNTTDVTNWQKSPFDTNYVAAIQISGTGATTSNTGNTLVDAAATFVTKGVTAGRDYVYISSTSGTVGKYAINSVDSETQLTLNLAPGASTSNVAYQIMPSPVPYPAVQEPNYLPAVPPGVGFNIAGTYALLG